MRVLGIDPGTAITGYGVVEKEKNRFMMIGYGSIITPKEDIMELRLEKIYDEMQEILKKYKPDAVAIEQLFFNTNAKTAIQVGQARGVILLACVKYGVEIAEYTPLQIKNTVVGYGRSQKKQVQQMVKIILNLKEIPKPDDSADGLACAISHFSFNAKLNKLKKYKK